LTHLSRELICQHAGVYSQEVARLLHADPSSLELFKDRLLLRKLRWVWKAKFALILWMGERIPNIELHQRMFQADTKIFG
jgi:hypothetical protein